MASRPLVDDLVIALLAAPRGFDAGALRCGALFYGIAEAEYSPEAEVAIFLVDGDIPPEAGVASQRPTSASSAGMAVASERCGDHGAAANAIFLHSCGDGPSNLEEPLALPRKSEGRLLPPLPSAMAGVARAVARATTDRVEMRTDMAGGLLR